MQMALRTRLRKLEQRNEGANSMSDERCICFPPDEHPNFDSDEGKQSALDVLCPVHGLRFNAATPTVFKSQWLRESEQESGHAWHSVQFHKALAVTSKGAK